MFLITDLPKCLNESLQRAPACPLLISSYWARCLVTISNQYLSLGKVLSLSFATGRAGTGNHYTGTGNHYYTGTGNNYYYTGQAGTGSHYYTGQAGIGNHYTGTSNHYYTGTGNNYYPKGPKGPEGAFRPFGPVGLLRRRLLHRKGNFVPLAP